MFISDLFEAQAQQTLVIIPGGFHPFHPGHLSLFKRVRNSFPNADIRYAATDDQTTRPFSFADKQKLAEIVGIPRGIFQQVRSPFAPREITGQYDPANTVLIFVRSEKDRDESPKPGGVKKDGSPAYLQPYHQGNLAPMSQHGYIAYLPTIEFDGMTSATEIRDSWPQSNDQQKNQMVQELYPRNPAVAKQILDKNLGGSVAEHIVKVKGGYELKAKHGNKNLGKYPTKAGAEKRERQVQYFKHMGEDITEGAPELLKAEMPLVRHIEQELAQYGYEKGTPEYNEHFKHALAYYRKFGNVDAIKKGVAEAGLGYPGGRSFGGGQQYRYGSTDMSSRLKPPSRPSPEDKLDIASQKIAKDIAKGKKKGMAEGGNAMDPSAIQMKKRARVAHPFASSDEEALLLYIADKTKDEFKDVHGEQDRELAMINRIEQAENTLEQEIQRLDHEIAQIIAMKK